MTRLQHPLFGFAAAVLIAISSVSFVKARHLAAGAQSIVICTGYGLVQVTVDSDGNPVKTTVPCPDCMPGAGKFLLAGAVFVRHDPAYHSIAWPAPVQSLRGISLHVWHHARAPPCTLA